MGIFYNPPQPQVRGPFAPIPVPPHDNPPWGYPRVPQSVLAQWYPDVIPVQRIRFKQRPLDPPPFTHGLRRSLYDALKQWFPDPEPRQGKSYFRGSVDAPPFEYEGRGSGPMFGIMSQWYPEPQSTQRKPYQVGTLIIIDNPPWLSQARTGKALGNIMDAWARNAEPSPRQKTSYIRSESGTPVVPVKIYLLIEMGGGVCYLQRIGYSGEVVYIEKV